MRCVPARKVVFLFVLAAAWCGFLRTSSAATVIKIGTLAPGDSPWGKEFKKLAADISGDTNGQLQLDFLWNGQAGDEVLMRCPIRANS
jgi:TRAP-type C4-dicarboxylate transport system substrate-binding protein